MARPEKFTVDQMIEAIRKAQTAAGAARILGCDSDTVRAYAKRHATVDRVLNSERRDLVANTTAALRRVLDGGAEGNNSEEMYQRMVDVYSWQTVIGRLCEVLGI